MEKALERSDCEVAVFILSSGKVRIKNRRSKKGKVNVLNWSLLRSIFEAECGQRVYLERGQSKEESRAVPAYARCSTRHASKESFII